MTILTNSLSSARTQRSLKPSRRVPAARLSGVSRVLVRRALTTVILTLTLSAPTIAAAQDLGAPSAAYLRPEWSVERTQAGRAHVVGYLYNSGIRDAANVSLRVEQLTAGGELAATYRTRAMGDVLSRNRAFFDVPVSSPEAIYRVIVESVSWFNECR